jgi:CheY-specific phosphatase CheX
MNVSSDDKILATLCERVFEEVLPDCELLEQPEVDGEELELVAVVGFSGDDARGVLGLSAPSELLEQLHPATAAGETPTPDQLRDWAGELSNQLLGRLKIELRPYGVRFWVATPVVLRGVIVRIMNASHENLHKYTLTSHGERIRVWLDLTLEEGKHLQLVEEESDTALTGNILFF